MTCSCSYRVVAPTDRETLRNDWRNCVDIFADTFGAPQCGEHTENAFAGEVAAPTLAPQSTSCQCSTAAIATALTVGPTPSTVRHATMERPRTARSGPWRRAAAPTHADRHPAHPVRMGAQHPASRTHMPTRTPCPT